MPYTSFTQLAGSATTNFHEEDWGLAASFALIHCERIRAKDNKRGAKAVKVWICVEDAEEKRPDVLMSQTACTSAVDWMPRRRKEERVD